MTETEITPRTVRALILSGFSEQLLALGTTPEALADDFDLRDQGLVDSLGFIELLTRLEDDLGVEIDLDAIDPSDLTALGPLCDLVAVQARLCRATAPAPSTNGHRA